MAATYTRPSRKPRSPSLRASCDACGAAKLKCGRQKPACRRCVEQGLTCTYGISRRSGNPGKSTKSKAANDPNGTTPSLAQSLSTSKSQASQGSTGTSVASATVDGFALGSESASALGNMPLSSTEFDGNFNFATSTALSMDATFTDLSASVPASSSLGMRSNNDNSMTASLNTQWLDERDGAALGSLESLASVAPSAQPVADPLDQSLAADNTLSTLSAYCNGGDCSKEAYDILLKCRGRINEYSASPFPVNAPTLDAPGTIPAVNFGQILRSNRETRQKLEGLLACSCVRQPHIALVHASVLSMLLSSYAQTAAAIRSCGNGSTDVISETTVDTILPTLLHSEPRTGTSSPSRSGLWNATPSEKDSMMSTTPLAGDLPPTKNGRAASLDEQVENALRMQLILGEVRRTGCFIDTLAAQTFSAVADFSLGGVDAMHQSVTLWLRREHSRVTSIDREAHRVGVIEQGHRPERDRNRGPGLEPPRTGGHGWDGGLAHGMMTNTNASLFTDIIASLRACALVPVLIDGNPSTSENSIIVSRYKMDSMINNYRLMDELVHKCWSIFPDPPCDEKTYVFMWTIACDNYCMNHSTISWERSTPNTFVHLCSIVDRIGFSLERRGLSWIVGTRNCADYCRSTGMSGPLDVFLYPPEYVTPPKIKKIDEDFVSLTFLGATSAFCSYYDFCQSAKTETYQRVVTVSNIAANNDAIMRRSGTGA